MILLKQKDVEFMLSTLTLPPNLKKVLQGIAKGGELTADEADELRDCCTERLDEIGFDENYELTDSGRKLEELIDTFYIG